MRKGFTLVETLIYIALTAVLATGVVMIAALLLSAKAKWRSTLLVEQNARFTLLQMADRIESASSITSPVGAASSTLQLHMPDANTDPTVFTIANGRITMREGASSSVPLTSNETDVRSLTFVSTSGTPTVVRLTMTVGVRQAVGASQSVHSFSLTAFPRR